VAKSIILIAHVTPYKRHQLEQHKTNLKFSKNFSWGDSRNCQTLHPPAELAAYLLEINFHQNILNFRPLNKVNIISIRLPYLMGAYN